MKFPLPRTDSFLARLCRRVNTGVFRLVGELAACSILLGCSGVPFRRSTQLVLFAISACVMVRPRARREFIGSVSGSRWKKALLVFLYLYGAFALVGQRLLVYPLDKGVSLREVLVYAVTVLWFVPVVNTALWGLELLGEKLDDLPLRLGTVWFCALSLGLLLAPAAVHLVAFNPGVSSVDTYTCMVENARHLVGMEDWHPAFYCILLRAVQHVWDSTYAVIFLQWALWGYVWLELLLYLRKMGLSDWALLAAALVTGLAPGNFVDLNTIWKDIPYALCLLWGLTIGAKLTLSRELYRGKWYIYLELALALTGIFLLRKNGVVTYVVIALALGAALYRNWRFFGALALSLALIALVKGPLYSRLEVRDVGRKGMYIGLGQDILGVYYGGGELSPETMEIVLALTNGDPENFTYRPTYAKSSYEVDVAPGEFIRCYLDTFIRHPVLMTRAVVAREDALWNIFPGENVKMGCVNYNGTMDGWEDWNEFYPERRPNRLTGWMETVTGWSEEVQVLGAGQWRSGLWTFAGLLAAALLLAKGRGGAWLWAAAAPVAGHILSLLLSTGWSDFRYFWPLNLMNAALCLLALLRHTVPGYTRDGMAAASAHTSRPRALERLCTKFSRKPDFDHDNALPKGESKE